VDKALPLRFAQRLDWCGSCMSGFVHASGGGVTPCRTCNAT
jgi:hypothetical protein